MTSKTGKQTIITHILHNTSRSKGNQTMKYVQLAEYIMRHIFLEKLYTKCDEEAITRPFSKAFLWINSLKFYTVCFYGMSKLRNILKLRCRPLAFASYKAVPNGQSSFLTKINADVLQDSILGLLLFLIYINDLSDNLQCNPKLFADDSSLFSNVKIPDKPANNLSNIKEINNWVF